MIHISRNVRKAWDEYVRSIFLRYIMDHPEANHMTFFPAYFQRELNLSDSYTYLRKLIKKGYLVRKNEGILQLSEKGREAIKDEYIQLFDIATPYVTFSEYEEEKEQTKTQGPVEVILLSVLLKKLKLLKRENNYIGVKDVHLDVAELYERANITDRAMYHYLVSLYYDISGLEYYDELILYTKGKRTKLHAEQTFSGICIRPQVMQGIYRLKESYDPQMVHDIFEKEQININLCSESRMKMLVEELLTGKYEYSEWRKYFWKNYRNMIAYSEKYREKENM